MEKSEERLTLLRPWIPALTGPELVLVLVLLLSLGGDWLRAAPASLALPVEDCEFERGL